MVNERGKEIKVDYIFIKSQVCHLDHLSVEKL